MASTINADNGVTSGNAGLKYASDGTGILALQTNGTTAVTVDASQNTTLAGTLVLQSQNISPYVGFKNRIINGAMVINQRGTQTGSPLSAYTLDRWLFSRSGTGTSTVSQSSTLNYGGQYALNISSTHAAGEVFGIEQRIESVNSYDLAGKTVTVQFYANATTTAGALGSFSISLFYANSTDNFSSVTSIGLVVFTLTSTPTLFTATFSVPSAATTGLKLIFSGGQTIATGTITFNLGGVQLEKGSTATSFEYRPYGTELLLCQRYYTKTFPQSTVPAQAAASAGNLSGGGFSGQPASLFSLNWTFPTVMRANPTVTTYTPLISGSGGFRNNAGTETGATVDFIGDDRLTIYNTSSLGANYRLDIHAVASAEL